LHALGSHGSVGGFILHALGDLVCGSVLGRQSCGRGGSVRRGRAGGRVRVVAGLCGRVRSRRRWSGRRGPRAGRVGGVVRGGWAGCRACGPWRGGDHGGAGSLRSGRGSTEVIRARQKW
jgi:hypothetical protein